MLRSSVLRHVLGVVEVAEPGVSQRVDAGFVFVHQQPECVRVAVETLVDDISVIGSQVITPSKKAFII